METKINNETTTPKEKLYVCLNDDNTLSLETRFDVDAAIKNAEETYNSDMPFTVIGNISTPVEGKAFMIICKNNSSVFYDVITAASEEKAIEKLLSKKRFLNKNIEIKRVQDLTQIILNYYE